MLCCISCTKAEREVKPGENDGKTEFTFSAGIDDEWIPLRTKGDVTITDLQSTGDGWGVYAYYTGSDTYTNPGDVDGIIFNKRRVWWDGSAWQYYASADQRKEYWPMDPDEKVTFFAFAPYNEYSSAVTVDPVLGPQVAYTASTDLSAQKDLLWGTNTSGLPHRNVNLATYLDPDTNPAGTVDFRFRHAPAKVHFTINGATLGDESGAATPYGAISSTTNTPSDNTIEPSRFGQISARSTGNNIYSNRDAYYAYRTLTVRTTQVYRREISGYKILLNSVDMANFIREGTLNLNNTEAYTPAWTCGDDFINYSFNASQLFTAVANPGNEATLSAGWDTTYLGVDNDPKELLPTPNNYIYMVPKTAVTPDTESQNIKVTVTYHVIGLKKTVQFTRTTTTVYRQRTVCLRISGTSNNYYYRLTGTNGRNYYESNGTSYGSLNAPNGDNVYWETIETLPSSFVDDAFADVAGTTTFNYTQDNTGRGFKAEGSINTDIIGGRDYTINLYLDGRELNLTVIPQPWDLLETVYDYDQTLNPILQAITYDSDFAYQVIDGKVYINNRMGKFYFRLGSGKYLYWQASLIGDDAFAFTDENGEYLLDDNGDYLTSIRGNIGEEMNYIYVKATNTSSQVTSSAKLRIYLFDSDNHAVVALPREDWLFLNSMYTNGVDRVQEWTVVQAAN